MNRLCVSEYSRVFATGVSASTREPHVPPPRDMGASCIVREDLCGCATCASCAVGVVACVMRCLSSLHTHGQTYPHAPQERDCSLLMPST